MVEKDTGEKRKEKNLISMIKEKISDLRTGSITIIILIGLAVIGSLFAKYIITKIMAVDFVVIASSIALGIAGLIIVILAYVIIRWIGAAINRYFKEKGF
ncbi:hypothetical protein LCGC14_0714890 [marine sediment metagenome]|uniref:Uncharacterized protein n=1 Tax=marine sediment metagenome TaxID=412755 RepID=A0A0F9QIJ0_9ZZZZ